MAISSECSICFEEPKSSIRYLEGHYYGKVAHSFDAKCIREWLNINSDCPLCRVPLKIDELVRIPNPHFSLTKSIKTLFAKPIKRTLPYLLGFPFSYGLKSVVDTFAPQIISNFISGSNNIAAPCLFMVSLFPTTFVNTENVNIIFQSSIALAIGIACQSTVESVSSLVEIIIGAALTSLAIRYVNDTLAVDTSEKFKINSFAINTLNKIEIIDRVNTFALVIVGGVTAGKLTMLSTSSSTAFAKTVSVVFGMTMGFATTYTLGSLSKWGIYHLFKKAA